MYASSNVVSDLQDEQGLRAELARLRSENAALQALLANAQRGHGALGEGSFGELLHALPAFVAQIGPNLELKYLNRMAPGYREDEVIGHSILVFMDPACHAPAIEAIERATRQRSVQRYQAAVYRADGGKAHYETVVAPLDGTLGDCALLSFDVTGYADREQALAEREALLRSSVEATGVGLWRYDFRTQEVQWNARMREILGRDEPVGPEQYIALIVHPDDRAMVADSVAQVVTGKQDAWARHRIARPDGRVYWVIPTGVVSRDEQGNAQSAVGGLLDVTQLHLLEQRLRQAEKMESLATLTTGVAHNLNNLLGVARPTMDLLEDYVEGDGRELLDAAVVALDRASTVVRQLMVFAGKRHAARDEPMALVPVVERALDLARRSIEADTPIEFETTLERVFVRGDENEFSEVVHNLVLNARDALASAALAMRSEAAWSPRICVTLKPAEFPAGLRGADAQEFVLLTVEDNGPGMAESVRQRVFDPFFTTKGPGGGTGLGLAISWSTVRGLGGIIQCDSAPGQGARFNVYLPCADAGAGETAPLSQPAPVSMLRVLLVEDDELLSRTVSRSLTRVGHRVSAARGARAALAAASPDIDVVLLDQSLPDGLGTDIAPMLRERCAGARIVLFTGQDVGDDELRVVDAMLAKPATTRAILEALNPRR